MSKYRNIMQALAGFYIIFLGIRLVSQVYQGVIQDQKILFAIVGIVFVIVGGIILWMVYQRYKKNNSKEEL